MKIHKIDIGVVEFDAIDTEIKKFLILWDTKINPFDKLVLREADDSGDLSGEEIEVKVDYLVRGGKDGIESGYVGVSVSRILEDDKLVTVELNQEMYDYLSKKAKELRILRSAYMRMITIEELKNKGII